MIYKKRFEFLALFFLLAKEISAATTTAQYLIDFTTYKTNLC